MGRAGEFVSQPAGFRAFVPAPLPPRPAVRFDAGLQMALSLADQALGRLDGAADILPNPELFVAMFVRQEALLSSQIEGTQASLLDVLEFEARPPSSGPGDDVGEVVNYVAAMNYGLTRLKDLPLGTRLLREIHGVLLRTGRGSQRHPGELRDSQNWIGPQNAPLERAIFVPPPPHDMRQAMSDLERFLHDAQPMPWLVKAGLAHAQFESIHPFLDGNGRMGRLLITLLLVERGVIRRPLLYLSTYLKGHRDEYYLRLQAVRTAGDWEGWLGFFLQGVAAVAAQATDVACRILRLREDHRQRLETRGANATALRLLDLLYEHPVVSIDSAARGLGVALPTANRAIEGLVAEGLLRQTDTGKRNRRYVYHEYVGLFEAPVGPEAGEVRGG